MRIQFNMSSLPAFALQRTQSAIARSLDRLSSGNRISSPREDIASFSAGVRLNSQVRGFAQISRSINDALSSVQVADSAISSQIDLVQKMRELAMRASGSVLSSADRDAIQKELSQLLEQFNLLASSGQTGISVPASASSEEDSLSFDLPATRLGDIFKDTVGTGLIDDDAEVVPNDQFIRFQGDGGSNLLSAQYADINNDGAQDIVIASEHGFAIYVGDGGGGFSDAGTYEATNMGNVRIEDLDNDGYKDIVSYSTQEKTIYVLVNNQDGSFRDKTFSGSGIADDIRLANVTGSHDIDLVVLSNQAGGVLLYEGFGDGSFGNEQLIEEWDGGGPDPITSADVTGDGHDDELSIDGGDVLINYGVPIVNPGQFISQSVNDVQLFDMNRDGNLDLVSVSGVQLRVQLGNGDGTFGAIKTQVGGPMTSFRVGDLNGDGVLDVVTQSSSTSIQMQVFLGKGDGSFNAAASLKAYSAGASVSTVSLGDFNNDGILDVASLYSSLNSVLINLGKGDGTFYSSQSYATSSNAFGMDVGDFNGDGKVDLVVAGSADYSIHLGDGAGHFGTRSTFTSGNTEYSISVADINNDGNDDLVSWNSGFGNGGGGIYLGRGNGSFQTRKNFSADSGMTKVSLGDFNGDSVVDILAIDPGNGIGRILLGRGDGNFDPISRTFATGIGVNYAGVGDINGDGALDIATAATSDGRINLLFGESESKTQTDQLRFDTAEKAQKALKMFDLALENLAAERSKLNAIHSQLDHRQAYIQLSSEAATEAQSNLFDVDLALETAEIVKNQMLQQVQAAILAQSNLQLQTVLGLLKPLN